MKNNKYKILVLSDLKNTVNSALKSTVSLAKMIDADIDFFYVKKPTEVVESENQLSAKRSINRDHIDTEKRIKKLVEPFNANYNLKINASFSFGNAKDEILKQIKASKPDIIVLGKRKPSAFKLLGDSMTNFIIKNYSGTLFLASEENGLEPQKELTLGVFNSVEESFNIAFAKDLINHSNKPLKSFKIAEKMSGDSVSQNTNDVIEYVFEKNDNTMDNLFNYLQKSNINLFCLKREGNRSQFKEVINKLNVSLLLSNSNQEFALN